MLVKKAIYVASTDEFSGKSAIIIALATMAMEMREKVGYFKPIGMSSSLFPGRENMDEDVEIMRLILKLKPESSILCPIILKREEFLKEFSGVDILTYAENIHVAYKRASENNDLMLIEGPRNLSVGAFLNCPVPRLAKDLNAEILLVERVENDDVVDDVLHAQDYCIKWGTKLFGVILNRIPQDRMEHVERVIKPFIERHGVKVLGLIPEDKALSAPTVREICDFIGGRVLAGKDGLDKVIEAVLIGAMTPESAAKYFRKVTNEIVITGGDRTDIVLTALETGVSAIILTGNLYPSVKVLPKADQLNVPLILVPYDTYMTLQHIQKIIGRIKPRDPRRISAAVNIVKKNVEWEQIIGA
ncbi:MAG: phosphotransacetylase family protein [Candidatus Bathyarchaeia archaeon]